jgi:hypothetical protein
MSEKNCLHTQMEKAKLNRREFILRSSAMLMAPTLAGLLRSTGARAESAAQSGFYYEIHLPGGFAALDVPKFTIGGSLVANQSITGINALSATSINNSMMLGAGTPIWTAAPLAQALTAILTPQQLSHITFIDGALSGQPDIGSSDVGVASSVARVLPTALVPAVTNNNNGGFGILSNLPAYTPVQLSSSNPQGSLLGIVSPAVGNLSTFSASNLSALASWMNSLSTSQAQQIASMPIAGATQLYQSVTGATASTVKRYNSSSVAPNVAGDPNIIQGFGSGISVNSNKDQFLAASLAKAVIDNDTAVALFSSGVSYDNHDGTFTTMQTNLNNFYGQILAPLIKTFLAAGRAGVLWVGSDGGIQAQNNVYVGDNSLTTQTFGIFINPNGPAVQPKLPRLGSWMANGQGVDQSNAPVSGAGWDDTTMPLARIASVVNYFNTLGLLNITADAVPELSSLTSTQLTNLSAF